MQLNRLIWQFMIAAALLLAATSAANAYGRDYCREYTSRSWVGGRSVETYGRACMEPDGSWRIASEQQGYGGAGYEYDDYAGRPPVYIDNREVIFVDREPDWYRPPHHYYGGHYHDHGHGKHWKKHWKHWKKHGGHGWGHRGYRDHVEVRRWVDPYWGGHGWGRHHYHDDRPRGSIRLDW
jgi:hypothetical protein